MTTEHFGRYEIKGEIGRGGMATVFHAYDPRFERDVAIKVLPREFLHDTQFRTRFEREAKTIALLEHPAIVPVYDFGEEEGQPYIVMRYMAGGSLADRLNEGPLNIEDAVKMISRLAPALDAAHARGIIHRDLKPGNILYDQYGNAFLSDFGIARLKQAPGVATLTGGAILGTPAYMSPEQIQGDTEVDGRSDIYAMGVILYQVLTGKTPYQADTPAKVMMMHILEPVPSILDQHMELPATIGDVVEKTLAKKPDDRYPTMGEFSTSIEQAARTAAEPTQITPGTADRTRVAAGATVVSPGTGTAEAATPARAGTAIPTPAPKDRRRIPTWVWVSFGAVVVLVIAAIVIGGGAALIFGGRSTPTSAPSNTPEVVALATQPAPTSTATATVPTPTDTPVPPTPEFTATLPPTSTDTEIPPTPTDVPTEIPAIPVIGGSDKIAMLRNNDIWVTNLDGTDLVQLTTDGAQKTNLRWTHDGQELVYISGLCIQAVSLDTGRLDTIACFDYVGSLDAFEISPDGSHAAISINQNLYIIPFDRERLGGSRYWTDVRDMSVCQAMAPYASNTGTAFSVKQVRWSNDMQYLAIVLLAAEAGVRVDKVVVVDISNCDQYVDKLDEFPGASRFEISGYMNHPVLENVAWDGMFLFAMIGYVRNEGFGDLYLYNWDLHRATLKANPIGNTCCYRDPSWSPDGSNLIFAYQDIGLGPEGTIQLYIIPYGTLGTGLQYAPIPLPDDFFTDPKESPQPVLRPAQTGD